MSRVFGVGSIRSLSPFARSAGCAIFERSCGSSLPQLRQALELREVRADGGRRVPVDRALLESSQERLAFTLAVRGPGEEEELLRVLATQQMNRPQPRNGTGS